MGGWVVKLVRLVVYLKENFIRVIECDCIVPIDLIWIEIGVVNQRVEARIDAEWVHSCLTNQITKK